MTPVPFDDCRLDGRYQPPRLQAQTKASSIYSIRMVLFKIFFNVLFSLCGPVDSAFYLICPKHTSLIFAAGCVRGSVSLPLNRGFRPGFSQRLQPLWGACRGQHTKHSIITFPQQLLFTPAPTPQLSLLTYIFINSLEEVRGKKSKWKKKKHNRLRMKPSWARGVFYCLYWHRGRVMLIESSLHN